MTYNNTMRECVQNYITNGWAALPLPYQSKAPTLKEWTKRAVDDCDLNIEFLDKANVGIVLGDNSKGLVDIDLDHPDAVLLAPFFLPETSCTFGRASRPESHYLYYCDEEPSRKKFKHHEMIAEIRRNGTQTVLPPSIHPTGETISFIKTGTPYPVDMKLLETSVAEIAAATIIVQHWRESLRHELSLALAGWLLKSSWSKDKVENFIRAVCTVAHDEETQDRLRTITDSIRKQQSGHTIKGWSTLEELIGEDARQIQEWLFGTQLINQIGLSSILSPSDLAKKMSDLGNSELFVKQHAARAKFVEDLGCWAIWDGKKWNLDAKLGVRRLAHRTAESILTQPEAMNHEVFKWGKHSCSQKSINAMLSEAAPYISISQKDMDRDIFILNCANGTLDLRTGSLSSHNSDLLITQSIESAYLPTAQCPMFEDFLSQIFENDNEVIGFIQRALGYSLTGSTKEQCFFVAHGSGANGKSTLLETMEEILNDYVTTTPVSTLMSDKNKSGGIPNDIARLRGKRLIKASEGENHQQLSESLIKGLTGGDTITARFLQKEYFEFKPIGKIWLATNHKPQVSGDDPAIWRRVKLVPFSVTIPAHKQDKQLKEKLLSEKEGILAWIVRGCIEWQKQGLNTPAKITAATEAYKRDMDSLGLFIEECIQAAPNNRVTKTTLYDGYQIWCGQNGYEKLTKRTFGEKLLSRGYKDGRTGQLGHFWADIEVATPARDGEFDA